MACNDFNNKIIIESPAYLKIYTKGHSSAYNYDSVLYLECMPDWVSVVYIDVDGVSERQDVFPRNEIMSIFSKSDKRNAKSLIDKYGKEAMNDD